MTVLGPLPITYLIYLLSSSLPIRTSQTQPFCA